MQLIDLDAAVIHRIIGLLPQQSVLNLCLTNYHFYIPCTRQLYRNIVVQYDPIAHPQSRCRKSDYLDSAYTIICGFNENNGTITFESHLKLIRARLKVLCDALEVNPALILYIERVLVLEGHSSLKDEIFAADAGIRECIARLLRLLAGHRMEIFHVANQEWFEKFEPLLSVIDRRSVYTDNNLLALSLHTTELTVGPHIKSLAPNLDQLTSLILPLTLKEYWTSASMMKRFPPNLSHLRLVLGEDVPRIFQTINFGKLDSLDLICDASGFDHIPSTVCTSLRKLWVTQASEHDTHTANEQFDVAFMCMLGDLGGVQYCSLQHKCPDSGNFEDGFEGNYLRRMKIFCDHIPRVLNELGSQKKTLVLVNVFESLACYEQAMNTMVWNGCKCESCVINLGMVDTFLHLHKAHHQHQSVIKDINASDLFCNVGREASKRWIQGQDISARLPLFPITNRYWDRHTSNTGVPFYCFDQQLDGEYDLENEFFDAHAIQGVCKQTKWDYVTVIAHHINRIVERITSLARENAEMAKIGLNMHDASGYNSIEWLVLNGVPFTLDRESNGINFYCDVYGGLRKM